MFVEPVPYFLCRDYRFQSASSLHGDLVCNGGRLVCGIGILFVPADIQGILCHAARICQVLCPEVEQERCVPFRAVVCGPELQFGIVAGHIV